uniref:Uncharacterized protein n=1 Tax=Pyramimonas obovata TaxID=1411642 RepID=A0A7S0MY41_9CHLO|mmetsp:Transcript_16237/g.35283  ORF Transcript_16237/g.35283 Transcript_16237/m.35283 type:complete len:472 (+) Transcript_16237:313-1728(+)|eukprot:CAMPEP_0118937878 /NCGR_PEP_ID=MMETSP1169-20130426/24025_1 /TAXON_ID=36882 /ORGANISM="Pyramimonas obovata, Strain CCMP722" /LENGTH=471 /DNA_ID=CAMNT_0006881637 /DNA_START=242 /DNA_END=1657 /DNA_ORIENTATION=-
MRGKEFGSVVLCFVLIYAALNAYIRINGVRNRLPAQQPLETVVATPNQKQRPARVFSNASKCDYRSEEYQTLGVGDAMRRTYADVIRSRVKEKDSWGEMSCSRWGLSGEWKPRGRKIYYGTNLANEMDLLSVVLEEIYPVVDHIILQEARHTWGQGFTKEKPLYFKQFARTHFAKYLPKTRYQEYDFNSISECTPEATGGVPEIPSRACKWQQQWNSRNHLEKSAGDIREQDIFLVSDLDELVSREFLLALKNCEVHREMEAPGGKCTKINLLTFGHKYNFECTAARPAGHFHPDLTLGKCMKMIGGEEIRSYYGADWNTPHKLAYSQKYRPQEVSCVRNDNGEVKNCHRTGTVPGKALGPAGWHLMSFLSSEQLLFKQYTRAGPQPPDANKHGWSQEDLAAIVEKKDACNERSDIFRMDSWGCMPLPHAVRENPQRWRHFLHHVPDNEYPDEFGTMRMIHDFNAATFRGS